MAVRMCEVLASPWDGVCVPVTLSLSYWIYWHTNQGNSWYAFPAHAVGGLRCDSQPIAPTCIVWSWRLKECFALALAEKCLWDTGSPCSLNRQLCHAIHGYHVVGDMAVRMCEVLARPWDGVCVPLALTLSHHKCRPLITNLHGHLKASEQMVTLLWNCIPCF